MTWRGSPALTSQMCSGETVPSKNISCVERGVISPLYGEGGLMTWRGSPALTSQMCSGVTALGEKVAARDSLLPLPPPATPLWKLWRPALQATLQEHHIHMRWLQGHDVCSISFSSPFVIAQTPPCCSCGVLFPLSSSSAAPPPPPQLLQLFYCRMGVLFFELPFMFYVAADGGSDG